MTNQLECVDPEKIIAISRSSTSGYMTGTWGTMRPVHEEKLSPCRVACPVGNSIPQALLMAANEDFDGALNAFLEENPLPGVCGRVCYHLCQTDCNRAKWDGEVSIRALERAASEMGNCTPQPLTRAEQGYPIAVVGSGPAGLSASYHLARMGHAVTLFEAEDEPGGMLRWGIPEYRLPLHVLQKDIERIMSLGITLRTGISLKGRDILEFQKDHKAVFLAFGAQMAAPLDIPGIDCDNVLYGTPFLKEVRKGEIKDLTGKVLVIGGGNVALDTALTTNRLGASRVEVVCLEHWDEMPAHEQEKKDCKEEGISFRNGWGPRAILSSKGKAQGIELIKCTSVFDRDGIFNPTYDESETVSLDTDYIIISIGQAHDRSCFKGIDIERSEKGILSVNYGTLETSIKGVFAGGDMVKFPGSVAEAIASGKCGAVAIHHFVTGSIRDSVDEKAGLGTGSSFSIKAVFDRPENWDPGKVVRFEDMEPLFLDNQPPIEAPRLIPEKRKKNFDEINLSFTKPDAIKAAGRCFYCGACTACDRCFVFCPEGSVLHPEEGKRVYGNDSEHCKGCAVCEAVCLRGVMRMGE